MTRIIDTPKALLVEVPEGIKKCTLYEKGERKFIGGILPNGNFWKCADLPPQYSYGQPILAGEMTTDKIAEVFDFYQGEPPYQPYYRPYGMSEEEYIHEVRIAEHKLSKWETENHPDNQFFELLRSHNMKPETTVVITKN